MSTTSFDPGAPHTGGGIYGLPHTAEDARVILIPVPWEPTTSYGRGTARGPAAILRASRQVDLYDRELGRPWEAGIAMLDVDPDIVRWNAEACAAAEPVIEAGGQVEGDPELTARLARVNELSARLNERVAEIARAFLDRGRIVGLVGGDHASPYGAIAAHAARYPGMGVLHIDAHADLRRAYEGFTDSHASILYNVATRLPAVRTVVQVGIRDFSEEEADFARASGGRVVTYHDEVIAERLFGGEPFHRIADEIIEALPEDVYVTFDIDGLDPSLCPHTGTPVPGGLSFQQATGLLARLRRSGRRIVGFDLNEVAPGPSFADDGDGVSHEDEWDANVGARLLYKLIGNALASQSR
ncbi:MAG TPA: agmatinase family protein [Candidatus Nanopelagicales bacterium]|nr:agmatinase family protein [Candidatus Nanopelagicales bacterium]